MELLTLCRSCMVEVASWELQNFDENAVEMYIFCTNIEVSEDDKLPKQFCYDCKIKIESSYIFIKKAQEVNVILQNMLTSYKSSVIDKSKSLTNDLQYNESNSLEPDSGFSSDVKIDKHEEKLFSSNSNRNIEYKMEFDIYQTSPQNSDNELDESLSNREFDLPKMKLNSNIDDFDKHSDEIHDHGEHIVQNSINSKKVSNCTNNNRRKKTKAIKKQKGAPELEIPLGRNTNNFKTRLHKSHKYNTTKKEKEKKNEDEENFFKCDICKKMYKYKMVLQKHIKNEHSKEKDEDRPEVQEEKGDNTHPVVKTCDICNRTFKSTLWFSRHMNEHSHPRRYFCKHCPKSFLSYNTYRRHTYQHAESSRFACGECGARFKRGAQLAEHALAQEHARPHVCTKCGMAFKTQSILTSHMNLHLNEKRFLCGICGFSTKLLETLNNHMRTHSGEKPFACKECTYRTKTAADLRRHALRHRGERPHACQHCGKRFYETCTVARHIRQVHTGERPYQCYLCPQAFTDTWKCKLHIKSAHNIPLEEIPRISKNWSPKKETVSQPS